MPYVNFGTKDEDGFELVESLDLMAVRTRSHRSIRGVGPVLPPTAAEVADSSLVAAFPEAGVEVYRVPIANRSISERKRSLRTASDVQFAGSVLVLPNSQEPVLYTENIYIRFRDDLDSEDCEAIVRQAGLIVKEKFKFAANAYFLTVPEGTGQQIFEMAQELLQRDDVIYCHPELIQRRSYKQIFPEQWHLKPTTVGGVTLNNAHANVEAAHTITEGKGITIAVIDDGVDIDHPEFMGIGKIVAPRDVTLKIDDPRPKDDHWPNRRSGENHGTACAGVACANGLDGASGVAPKAKLMPIRLMSGLGSREEADAFYWAANNGADVISCSWGPPDGDWTQRNTSIHQPLPPMTRDAIDYAVIQGRGGKGCVICWAAGNGNESVDNDGYASYDKVIAVAACNDRSKKSVYSDYGEAIWCAFPSNDFGYPPFNQPQPLTPGIWTTDRLGVFGYNPGQLQFGSPDGKYSNDFGGTSSACPGAAGVAALVLAVNENLRWNEVKDILKQSCDRIDPQNGEYDSNEHSKLYGYGRLNAETAVKLANEKIIPLVIINKLLNVPIPDLGEVTGTIDNADSQPVEKVALYVRLKHTYIGDLIVTGIPPADSGMPTVILHNGTGGSLNDLEMLYDLSNTPSLAAYSGQRCNGTWTIRVKDKAAQDSGTLEQIGLQLFFPKD